MKILFCGKCFAMRSLKSIEKVEEWTYCDCKQMAARWDNPEQGTVQVLAQIPDLAMIIGMNNSHLRRCADPAQTKGITNEQWQSLHALAAVAPGYVFDAHNRNSWACVLRVGETIDISWHPCQERIKAGEAIQDVLFQPVRIKINAMDAVWKHRLLTYKDIVELAGKDSTQGTLYSITCYVKGKEGFCVSPGQTVIAEAGMIINCVFTGGA